MRKKCALYLKALQGYSLISKYMECWLRKAANPREALERRLKRGGGGIRYTLYIFKCSFTYTMAKINPPLAQCFHIIFPNYLLSCLVAFSFFPSPLLSLKYQVFYYLTLTLHNKSLLTNAILFLNVERIMPWYSTPYIKGERPTGW